MAQINGHTTLIAVDTEIVATFTTLKRRSPSARIIAHIGLLELDNIGPHVAEHLGAVGTGQGP